MYTHEYIRAGTYIHTWYIHSRFAAHRYYSEIKFLTTQNKMHSEKVSTATSTSSNESRKSSKPIMEKRRRARMNASLSELKSLLLEVMKKDGNRHSKMEKADILEMTVKHLRHLQRQHFTVPTTKEESPFLTKYSLGFQECTSEVSRYLSSVAEVDTDIRTRLLNHLATYVSQPSTPSTVSSTASSPTSTTSSSAAATAISTPISRPSSVTDIAAVHSPAASVTSPPSPSTTQRLTPLPSTPSSHIQLQLTPSLAQSPSSVQSSKISMSTVETTTGSESMVAPKQITIFPADFCTATTTTTTTATESTFSAPASGGILSLDTSCPQVPTAKLLSGVQLITTRLSNGQMAFILPTNLMTETQQAHQPQPQPQPRQQSQQSYIPIPVFAPTSTSITPLSSTVSGQPGVMALLPQVPKNSVTPTTSMAFMPHVFQLPQMTGVNSPFSHLPLVNAYPSETTASGTGLSLPVKLPSSITEMKHPVLLPELTKTQTASTPSVQLQTPAKREDHIIAEPVAPVPQPTEEENVWRPWAH